MRKNLKNSKDPFISLILVVKNGMPFIYEALESVAKQTYRNFELVVQDGVSTDGTLRIIERFKDKINLKLQSKPDNGGCQGWKWAMERCKGDIIGSIDSDNMLVPHTLERVVKLYKKNPKMAVIYGESALIDGQNRLLGSPSKNVPVVKFDPLKLLRCELVPPLCSAFFHKQNCRGRLWMREDIKTCNDFDLWLRLSDLPILSVRGSLAFMRAHPKSSTYNPESYDQFCRDKITVLGDYLKSVGENHITRALYIKGCAGIYAWAANSVFNLEGKSPKYHRYVKKAIEYDPEHRLGIVRKITPLYTKELIILIFITIFDKIKRGPEILKNLLV